VLVNLNSRSYYTGQLPVRRPKVKDAPPPGPKKTPHGLDRALWVVLSVVALGAVGMGAWVMFVPPTQDVPTAAGYAARPHAARPHAAPQAKGVQAAKQVKQKLQEILHPPIPGVRLNG
jgi:hypothetical protein